MKPFLILAFAIATTACGPFCKSSTVGYIGVFRDDKALCEEYDPRLEIAIQFLLMKNNPSANVITTKWDRYSVVVRETPTWEVQYPDSVIKVAGMTDCIDYRMSVVGHTDEHKSALFHEMIHYMQNCESGPKDADGHKYWGEQGIWSLIDEFNEYVRTVHEK